MEETTPTMPSALIDVCKECHQVVTDFLRMEHPYTALEKTYKQLEPFPHFHSNLELHQATKAQVANTYNIFTEALDVYSLEELSISYNGGKDCLVMLVIYLAAIYGKFENKLLELKQHRINSVYINNETTFEEQDEFLYQSAVKYQLSLIKIKDRMKAGFEKYLVQKPQVKAIIVGIRRIDPFGANLAYIQRTDRGWPDFIRINPVLEWTYCEIWYFLKATNVEYCRLYDSGYTSIGGIDNTVLNPLLKRGSVHWPAYMLEDDEHERLSRASDGKGKDERRVEEKL